MGMTSRERMKRACNFEKPDRIPIGLGATRSTTFHIDTYANLVRYLGMNLSPPKAFDICLMKAHVDMEMVQWMGADAVMLESIINSWNLPNEDYKPFTTNLNNVIMVPGGFDPIVDERGYYNIYNDKSELISHMSPTGLYFDTVFSTWMSDEIEYRDPAAFVATLPMLKDEHLGLMEKRARILFENTDYAIHGNFVMYDLFGINIAGHSFADWMILLASEPEYCEGHIQALTEWTIKNLEMYLQAVGKYLHSILISTADFGTQQNEIISPDIFASLFVPAYRKMSDYIHRNTDVKVMAHCCGSIKKIIPHFIDAGIDIINPIQTQAAGMSPQEIVDAFGGKIVLWGGGADIQRVLPNSTPEEVKEHVKENISILGAKGGYVFTPTHNIQPDVPPENIVAMIEAVKEFGVY